MSDVQSVIDSAQRLSNRDQASLELLIGMRERAIEKVPALRDNPDFELQYERQTMGPVEDLKALGRSILNRWNVELHGIVCGNSTADQSGRKAILDSLNLGEAAMIAAVAGALLSMGAAAALAAAVAPLIVKRFVAPAKDELCAAWSEAIKDQG
jgi:hypothetical protein